MKKYAYLILNEDGTINLVEKDTHYMELKELYVSCNCETIDIVKSGAFESILMCVDDCGLLNESEFNPIATMLYQNTPIAGKVVVGTSDSPLDSDEPDMYAMKLSTAKALKKMLEFLYEEAKDKHILD